MNNNGGSVEKEATSVFVTSVQMNEATHRSQQSQSDINTARKAKKENKPAGSMPLHNSSLVVNQEPDIPLKVDTNYKSPDLLAVQKQQNLERLTQAMSKLESIADLSKVRFENKLKEDKIKISRLKELIEIDEYERTQRFAFQKNKQISALRKVEKKEKELENKQLEDYKSYLKARAEEEKEKEKKQRAQMVQQMKENWINYQKEQEILNQKVESIKKEEEEALKILETINSKLNKASEKQTLTIESFKKSRNEKLKKWNKTVIEKKQKQILEDSHRFTHQSDKYKQIQQRRLKVEEDRLEYMTQLQRLNRERQTKRQQMMQQNEKDRDKWSLSILQKHKKQWDQVLVRNSSIEDLVQSKRELSNLKFNDQNLNLKENIFDRKQSQEHLAQKHSQLYASFLEKKEKLRKLEQTQRLTEIQKKREMFNNYWNQSIKPANKMLEVSLKKVLLKDDPIVKTGAMIWNLKALDKESSEEEDEEYYYQQ